MFSSISIEFNDSTIKIIEGIKKRNSLQVLKCVSVMLPEGYIEGGEIKNMEAVKDLLDNTLRENSIKTRSAMFIIESNSVISRKIELPFMSRKKDSRLMVRYNIEEMFSANSKQYVFMYKLSDVFMKEKVKYSSCIIQCLPVQIFNQYTELAKNLKLELKKLDISSNCLESIWSAQFQPHGGEEKSDGVNAFVNISENGFSFSVLNKGVNEFFRIYYDEKKTESAEKSEETENIEKTEKTEKNNKSERVAEEYEVYSFIPFSEDDEVVKNSIVASKYSSIVSKYIKYYYSINKGKEEIRKMYVFGDDCTAEDAKALKLKLDMDVERIPNLSNIAYHNDFVKQNFECGNYISCSLAFFDKRNKDNFLSKMQQRHKIKFNAGLSLAAAAIVLVILLSFKGINKLYEAAILENELESMRLFVYDEANIRHNKEIEEKMNEIENLKKYVKNAVAARNSISNENLVDSFLFREIMASAPASTKVSSVSVDKSSIVIVSSSAEMKDISSFMSSLRNKEFISEVYVPEIEMKKEADAVYSYRILCEVGETNEIK